MTKTCRGCDRELALSEFHDHPQMRDGHLNFCKECVRARMRAYYQTGSGQASIARRMEHRAEKIRATKRVYEAIRKGKLQRQPCEVCGSLHVQAHHDDYDRPLDVRWLCPTHHGLLHRTYVRR